MAETQHRLLTADVYHLPDVARICLASLSTVRHWIAIGRLKSIKPGRRRLVLRADLAKFLGLKVEE